MPATTGKRRMKRPPAALAALLASGKSYTAIAAELGCERHTVAAWAVRPEVAEQVGKFQQEASRQLTRRLRQLSEVAVDVVEEVAIDVRQPAQARVRAAEAILSRGGFPSSSQLALSGEVEVEVGVPAGPEADRTILLGAADVLRDRGLYDLADAVKAAAEDEAGEGVKS